MLSVPECDPFLQARWSDTRAKLLAHYPNDVQGAVRAEWMEIASARAPGDVAAAFRLAARANIAARKSAENGCLFAAVTSALG